MKRVFKIFSIVLLVAAVIGTFVYLWMKSRPEEKVFETTQAEIRTIEKNTLATGKIQPRDEVKIKPQISGVIDKLYKEAGQKVQQGELIAKLKVIPDMNTLANAEASIKLAKIKLEKAQTDYNREKQLYDRKLVSDADIEEYDVTLRNAKEELQRAQDLYDIAKEGATKSSQNASTTYVRSTVSGTILDIPEKEGNSVVLTNNFNEGTTIATVANMNDMLFVGKIDETEVGKLNVGMPLTILIGAIEGEKYDAVLEYIAPKGTEENGAVMFEIKAAIKIPEGDFLRAGYSANAQITLSKADSVISIQENALQFEGSTPYVEVLTSEKPVTYERRNVTTGLSDGMYIEIKEGVTTEDKLKVIN